MSDGDQVHGPRGTGKGPKPPAGPALAVSRPGIRLTTEIHDMVDAAILALDRDPELYQRDVELVRVVRAEVTDAKRGVVAGSPQIKRVEYPTMLETLSRVAVFFADTMTGSSPKKPPKDVAAAVLARGQWPGVRPLAMVTETPSLRPDGTVLDRPGYDSDTAIVLLASEPPYPAMPSAPTQADAMRALMSLLDLFAEFPFSSEAGRYVAVAAILTMLARPAIIGAVPAMLFDASTRGSGKSLIENVISVVTTGRSAPTTTYPTKGLTTDEAELEKILSSAALDGARMLTLDNITGTFGCGPLDKCLTTDDRVAIRILGKTERRELVWRCLVIGSGNNISLGADTARRCLVARLEPLTESPEDRTGFKHSDLLGFARSHRGELVRDGLTVLRAFTLAGRPNAAAFTWGSFSAWAQLVPASIVFAGGANILEARAVSAGVEEPEADALRALLDGLPRLCKDHSKDAMTAKDIVTELYPMERVKGRDVPMDAFEDLRSAIEFFTSHKPGQAPDPKRLGNALRRHRGRILGGKRLTSAPIKGGFAAWAVRSLGVTQVTQVTQNQTAGSPSSFAGGGYRNESPESPESPIAEAK